jgi:hypothetical protein
MEPIPLEEFSKEMLLITVARLTNEIEHWKHNSNVLRSANSLLKEENDKQSKVCALLSRRVNRDKI